MRWSQLGIPFFCSLLLGCSDKVAPGEGALLPTGERFTRAGLLGAIGGCITTEAKAFAPLAADLSAKVAAAVAEGDKRAAAQDAWRAAMHVWERLDTMQLGPVAMSSLPGGQELRQAIYAWPAMNRCSIEQAVVNKRYEQPSFITGSVEVRGLLAAEYLLFYTGTDNACPATDAINASGSWAAIAPAELRARKLAYAKVLVDDVAKQAQALVTAWDPAQGNFVAQLASAGNGSTTYRSAQFALNSVSDAMFYLDADVKDMKVSRPAGLGACTTATCPEALESKYAGASKSHLRDNIDGFRLLFSGCGADHTGLGFDDYLYAVGATTLGKQIDDGAVAALATIDAIPQDDMRQALDANPDSVRDVFTALRTTTDLLKSQFISVLDLEIPRRIEGDND